MEILLAFLILSTCATAFCLAVGRASKSADAAYEVENRPTRDHSSAERGELNRQNAAETLT